MLFLFCCCAVSTGLGDEPHRPPSPQRAERGCAAFRSISLAPLPEHLQPAVQLNELHEVREGRWAVGISFPLSEFVPRFSSYCQKWIPCSGYRTGPCPLPIISCLVLGHGLKTRDTIHHTEASQSWVGSVLGMETAWDPCVFFLEFHDTQKAECELTDKIP